MPKGYTPVEHDVPNPRPIAGYEDCQTRWTEDGVNKVWEDGIIYEKPAAPATPSTSQNEWVQNLDKVQNGK